MPRKADEEALPGVPRPRRTQRGAGWAELGPGELLGGTTSARGERWISPGVGRAHRSGRPGPGLPLRPHLAHLALDLHLRPRVPGHLRRPTGRRLLHARGALRRRRGRVAGRGRGLQAHRRAVAAARRRSPRRLGGDGGRHRPARGHRPVPQDPGPRRGLRVPQPAGLRRWRGVCPAQARPGHRAPPHRHQARRVLAAAAAAPVPERDAHRRHHLPRGEHRRVRARRLGSWRAGPGLVLLLQHRGARRDRAGLPDQRRRAARADGRRGVRRPGRVVRGVRVPSGASTGPPRGPGPCRRTAAARL